jgi:hypothetical protein
MYSRDTLVLLQHYLDLGLHKTDIAQQLGVSLRTFIIGSRPASSIGRSMRPCRDDRPAARSSWIPSRR